MGAEHAAGLVQAFQRGIAFRVDAHAAVDNESRRPGLQAQVAVAQLIIRAGQLLAVHGQAQQFQLLAIQHQQRQIVAARRVAPHHQLRMHQRVVFEQLEGQVRLIDQIVRCLVVLEVNHLRLFGAHGASPRQLQASSFKLQVVESRQFMPALE
ncbi:hypothetical protein D9M68_791780 [compost metagenome]